MKLKKLLAPILCFCFAIFLCGFACSCSNQIDKYKPVYKYTTDAGKDVYDWPAGCETGMIDVEGGKVAYWLYGKDKPGIPIVCVHGGPGGNCTCFYKQLPLAEDRPILLYNQLGSIKSEINEEYKTPDKITSLYTIDRFASELNSVIKHFNYDNFVLFGTSWGCMLTLEYAAKYQPAGLRGIVFGGPFLNVDMWINDAQRLLLSLDNGQHKLDVVKQCEASGVYTEEYKEINEIFMENFNNRHRDIIKDKVNIDTVDNGGWVKICGVGVYEYMWGESEFSCTGTLNHHDSTPLLSKVDVPVIYMPGQYDEGTPETALYYCSITKNGEIAVIPSSAHAAAIERPDEFNTILSQFIKRIETGEK